MTSMSNHYDEAILLGLKNVGSMYQQLMDMVFALQTGRKLEVYVDAMVIKTTKGKGHFEDLEETFRLVRKFNMRLNPHKCIFGVQAWKFLDFMVTHRGIEANPEKF